MFPSKEADYALCERGADLCPKERRGGVLKALGRVVLVSGISARLGIAEGVSGDGAAFGGAHAPPTECRSVGMDEAFSASVRYFTACRK